MCLSTTKLHSQVSKLVLGRGAKAGQEAKRLGCGLDSDWPRNNKTGIIVNGLKLFSCEQVGHPPASAQAS